MDTNSDMSVGHETLIQELYSEIFRTVDDLPYTDEFDKIYTEFVARSGRRLSKHDFWRAIANIRKAGRLIRKAR